MVRLSCRDLDPDSSCNYESMGSSEGEVARKMMAHAKANHADNLKGMSDADIMNMMRSKVHE